MTARPGAVTFQGNPLTLVGDPVETGAPAPDATLLDNELQEVSVADLRGKVLVLASVPSLDTPVCDAETRRFNEAATELGEDVEIVAISMDLPFAQARWCGAAGADRVRTLSDHRDAAFGRAYGVLIEELRLLARAIHIVDAEGVVRYRLLVEEITDEPDYAAVLAAVRELT